jgi:hypothetical protein
MILSAETVTMAPRDFAVEIASALNYAAMIALLQLILKTQHIGSR